MWDEASGYYYDAASGYYYDGNSGWHLLIFFFISFISGIAKHVMGKSKVELVQLAGRIVLL